MTNTDTELTPEQKFNAESAETMVPRALLQGRPREEIVADLVRLDWPPEAAEALIDEFSSEIERHQASPEDRDALVREYRTQMVSGLLMVLLGLLVTALSLFAASVGLIPIWFVFGGVILWGLVRVRRGYPRWRLYRHDKASFPRDTGSD